MTLRRQQRRRARARDAWPWNTVLTVPLCKGAPGNVGWLDPYMTNTDSDPFKDLVPSLSLRENERGAQIGGNWDPTHHQPIDVLTTFTDKDFMNSVWRRRKRRWEQSDS